MSHAPPSNGTSHHHPKEARSATPGQGLGKKRVQRSSQGGDTQKCQPTGGGPPQASTPPSAEQGTKVRLSRATPPPAPPDTPPHDAAQDVGNLPVLVFSKPVGNGLAWFMKR